MDEAGQDVDLLLGHVVADDAHRDAAAKGESSGSVTLLTISISCPSNSPLGRGNGLQGMRLRAAAIGCDSLIGCGVSPLSGISIALSSHIHTEM